MRTRTQTLLAKLGALALAASALVSCATAPPSAEAGSGAGRPCDASLADTFRSDPLTRVVLVRQFRAGEPLALSEPVSERTPRARQDLCMVKLVVGPGNAGPEGAPSTSPGIGIEVWLPSPENWTGRIHNRGGGGWVGGADAAPDRIGWLYSALGADAENAVASHTDTGHAIMDGSWAMNPDGTFAANLWEDFVSRSLHEQAVKTKAIAAAYYGRRHTFAYFEGSSQGGRQGYLLAQRYPDDYDGIVANMPAINFAPLAFYHLYHALVVERELGGQPLTEAQMDLASNAAIQACDVVGGEHLGYILDNAACRYDPSNDRNVLCRSDGGRNATPDCLTRAQANVINRFWYGVTADGSAPSPAVDNGMGLELSGQRLWYGLPRGTSLYNWFFTRGPGAQYAGAPPPGATPGGVWPGVTATPGSIGNASFGGDWLALTLGEPRLADENFRNATGNGARGWTQLTYAQLADAFRRAQARDAELDDMSTTNPDLSAFAASGGKMLSWHGWNDEAIPPLSTARYYDQVVQTMGGLDRVQSFYRLYMLPGGGHESPQGTSNREAFPPRFSQVQLYQLMVDWVENGRAPQLNLEGSSLPGAPQPITQPICAYPQQARYTSGDPRVASSYECRNR